ncbi:MAG TPA: acyltransferase [Acidimicrobiales bacterium]|nr:acyltransferase [Acidimicrobiales bacterium]
MADATEHHAVSAEASRAEATQGSRRSPAGIPVGYQPALDGVRAIAVGMVMIFHLATSRGFDVLGGGWLGVDVFFVLSGYLITSLLLAERRRHGRIGLRNFYVRRFLRLAPLSVALVLVLWLITATGLDEATGLDLHFAGGVSILAYYSNWWNIAHPDGLGSLGHVWSLSIEEQFYFVWPWVVVGAYALARTSARRVLIVGTAGAVVAIGLVRRSLWLSSTAPGASGEAIVDAWLSFFRNSLLRGDGLLFGCLLALVLHGVTVTPRLRNVVGAVAVAALVAAGFIVGFTHFNLWKPWVPFIPAWGLSAFNLSVTLVVAWLVVAPHSPLARLFSLRPLTWVGRRAYGIYLLHPLVLDVVATTTSLRRLPFEAVVVTGTFVIAGLSFRYFESPFLRLKERFSSR